VTAESTMVIDAFTHIYPKGYLDFLRRLNRPTRVEDFPRLRDVEAKIEDMDRHGIHRQVLTLSTPALNLFGPEQAKEAREAARIANDGIAEVVASHPDRFIGVATLPMLDIDDALGEFDRAAGSLGLKGVQIFSHVNETPIDDARFFALYDRITERDVPILLHPVGGDYNERTRDYMLWLMIGWPFETSVAMARMVYSGFLEKYPRLKIITHHLGAFVPHLASRIRDISRTLERSGASRLRAPALSYFKQFYGDTAVHGHKTALAEGCEFFGPDRILFGTDYPFVPLEETVESVREWNLSSLDREKILGGNARMLFKV
jgi:aminocarboxymuconate-semialdehyde decarboxylase